MKKLILLLGLMCMGFQCGDESRPIVNHGEWWVRNSASRTVMIEPGADDLRPMEIAPGATIRFSHSEFRIYETPDHARLVDRWYGWAEQNISFDVLSADGTPLVKWLYTDRDAAGRQFFDESAWTKTQGPGDRVDEIRVGWLFEITEADISQTQSTDRP